MSRPDRIQLTTLPNGFRIVTEHMPHVKSAALGIWVSAGARHEAQVESGLSHMLEHMAFKGTSARSAREIVEQIEDVGGDLNAYTDYEVTAYQARVLAEHVPLAIDIIADILRDSQFAEGEIEKERHVILQEIAERRDMPSCAAMEALHESAFPDQALGRPVIGSEETVRSFDRDVIAGYLGRHYTPERMILAVAGFVDHDAIVAQVTALFGDMPRGKAGSMEPARYRTCGSRVIRPIEQAHVGIAFPGPDSRDMAGLFRAQALSGVLGGGMSSRLFQELREERGLCYSIFAYAEGFEDTGTLSIYAATSAAQAEELLSVSIDVFARVADDLTEVEATRARAQSKAGLVMGLESPMRRAETLARQVALRGRVLPLDEMVAVIDAVDAAALRESAAKILSGPPPSAIYYGPEGGGLPGALMRTAA